MKQTIVLLLPISFLASCSPNQNGPNSPVAPPVNTSNPYGVPGVDGSSAYSPDPTPYQPIEPINPPATSAPSYPATRPAPAPSADLNGNVYTIKKGDSLWALSRRYGVTVDEIKSANGLASDTIVEGRTLIIPNR